MCVCHMFNKVLTYLLTYLRVTRYSFNVCDVATFYSGHLVSLTVTQYQVLYRLILRLVAVARKCMALLA